MVVPVSNGWDDGGRRMVDARSQTASVLLVLFCSSRRIHTEKRRCEAKSSSLHSVCTKHFVQYSVSLLHPLLPEGESSEWLAKKKVREVASLAAATCRTLLSFRVSAFSRVKVVPTAGLFLAEICSCTLDFT